MWTFVVLGWWAIAFAEVLLRRLLIVVSLGSNVFIDRSHRDPFKPLFDPTLSNVYVLKLSPLDFSYPQIGYLLNEQSTWATNKLRPSQNAIISSPCIIITRRFLTFTWTSLVFRLPINPIHLARKCLNSLQGNLHFLNIHISARCHWNRVIRIALDPPVWPIMQRKNLLCQHDHFAAQTP